MKKEIQKKNRKKCKKGEWGNKCKRKENEVRNAKDKRIKKEMQKKMKMKKCKY